MAARLAVLTGATGFLGRHVARALIADGWRLRILARSAPRDRLWAVLGAEVQLGQLGDNESLLRLAHDAQAVIHAAGLVKARRQIDFETVNAQGAGRMADAARQAAPGAAFVLISSLAARAPELSAYALSKRGGELAVEAAFGSDAAIVRLPALYGPEDRQTLGLFQAARASPLLPVLRREVRLPLLHVEDAARMIAALAGRPAQGRTTALCDERPQGYGLEEIMTATAEAVGTRPRLMRVPESALRLVGSASDLARTLGAAPIMTSGKVRELLHGDWSLAPEERAQGLPSPRYGLAEGFRHTAEWYAAAGWLPGKR